MIGVSPVTLSVSVSDQDQALAFWTQTIGFELISDERWAQPPMKMFFGWWAPFCDPDGNRFALNQRPD